MSSPTSAPESPPPALPPPAQAPQAPRVVLDIWMTSVTVIQMMSRGLTSHPCSVGSATGFFYARGDNKYLITNRHVVVDEKRQFYPDSITLRVHTNRGDLTQNRDLAVSLYDRDERPVWLEHPTHRNNVDIVAVNVDSYLQPTDFITPFSAANFVPSNVVPSLGDMVLVMGYPMRFYDTMHNLPITKSGTIASPYGVPFEQRPYFLIDANLQPGISGSPVVLPAGPFRRIMDERGQGIGIGLGQPHLLGITSGEYTVDSIQLGLHIVWYPNLIEQIVSATRQLTT